MNKNSKEEIIKAASHLIKTIPYEKITITKICQEANVSRVTFYHYFKDIDSIFEEVYYQLHTLYCSHQMKGIEYFYSDDFIKGIIEIYDKVSDIMIGLNKWNIEEILGRKMKNIYQDFTLCMSDDPYIIDHCDYYLSFIFEPICHIVQQWLRNNKKESKEELFQIIKHYQSLQRHYEN